MATTTEFESAVNRYCAAAFQSLNVEAAVAAAGPGPREPLSAMAAQHVQANIKRAGIPTAYARYAAAAVVLFGPKIIGQSYVDSLFDILGVTEHATPLTNDVVRLIGGLRTLSFIAVRAMAASPSDRVNMAAQEALIAHGFKASPHLPLTEDSAWGGGPGEYSLFHTSPPTPDKRARRTEVVEDGDDNEGDDDNSDDDAQPQGAEPRAYIGDQEVILRGEVKEGLVEVGMYLQGGGGGVTWVWAPLESITDKSSSSRPKTAAPRSPAVEAMVEASKTLASLSSAAPPPTQLQRRSTSSRVSTPTFLAHLSTSATPPSFSRPHTSAAAHLAPSSSARASELTSRPIVGSDVLFSVQPAGNNLFRFVPASPQSKPVMRAGQNAAALASHVTSPCGPHSGQELQKEKDVQEEEEEDELLEFSGAGAPVSGPQTPDSWRSFIAATKPATTRMSAQLLEAAAEANPVGAAYIHAHAAVVEDNRVMWDTKGEDWTPHQIERFGFYFSDLEEHLEPFAWRTFFAAAATLVAQVQTLGNEVARRRLLWFPACLHKAILNNPDILLSSNPKRVCRDILGSIRPKQSVTAQRLFSGSSGSGHASSAGSGADQQGDDSGSGHAQTSSRTSRRFRSSRRQFGN